MPRQMLPPPQPPPSKPDPKPEEEPAVAGVKDEKKAAEKDRGGTERSKGNPFKSQAKKKKPVQRPNRVNKRPPPRRPRRARWQVEMKRVRVARIAKPKAFANSKQIATRRDTLQSNPNSREAHRDLTRALARAGKIDEALGIVDTWLTRDRLDTDALLMGAELHARKGNRDDALRLLTSAMDTAPRNPNLHKRMAKTYHTIGLSRRACAHDTSLRALDSDSKQATAPAVDCGIQSDLAWLPTVVRPPQAFAGPEETKIRGDLVVTLEWQGPAELQLNLISPGGRTLNWAAQRARLRMKRATKQNKDGTVTQKQQIALPYLGRGRWFVEALAPNTQPGESTSAMLRVSARGEKTKRRLDIGHAPAYVSQISVTKEYRETGRRR